MCYLSQYFKAKFREIFTRMKIEHTSGVESKRQLSRPNISQGLNNSTLMSGVMLHDFSSIDTPSIECLSCSSESITPLRAVKLCQACGAVKVFFFACGAVKVTCLRGRESFLCLRGRESFFLCLRGRESFLCLRSCESFLCLQGCESFLCLRGRESFLCLRGRESFFACRAVQKVFLSLRGR